MPLMTLRATQGSETKRLAAFFCILCSCSKPSNAPEGSGPQEACVNSLGDDVNHNHDEHGHDTTDEHAHGTNQTTREDSLPEILSETGLYADIQSKQINEFILEFQPSFQLWSDDAAKARWAYIPECETIDTSDMNNWQFPVGTRLFKEFSVDGVRIETRIIERLGTGPRDFAYASYIWNHNESEATRVAEDGLLGAKGTNHDIPSKQECLRCHGSYALGGGRPSRALGFSALQLSHDGDGTTLNTLIENNRLSRNPMFTIGFPGSGVEKEALGYLHANCGSCHNNTIDGLPQTDLNFWIDTTITDPEATGTWLTAIDQPTVLFKDQHISGRIVPGNPDESAVVYRMSQRGNNAQMPPLATHAVDEIGLSVVTEWIEGLQ